MAFDQKTLKTLWERVDREIWIVTAAHAGRRGGLVATFVNQASIVPEMPRVLAGLAKTHETCALVEASGSFALHLVDDSQLDLVWRFGLQSSREVDKLEGLRTRSAATESPILCDAVAWLDCRVEGRLDIGDRMVYLGQVVDGQLVRDVTPLCLSRLMKLAPADKLATLRVQMEADAAKDREAISRWRGTQQAPNQQADPKVVPADQRRAKQREP